MGEREFMVDLIGLCILELDASLFTPTPPISPMNVE